MSITDELRKYARGYETMVNHRLLDIADRIDERHERGMADAELGASPTEEQMAELGWVKLPVDADGVPIRLRDTVHDVGGGGPFEVKLIIYSENGHTYASDGSEYGDVLACNCCHVQPDSWERIIEDAIREGMSRQGTDNACGMSNGELVDRCRRLAGGIDG